MIVEVCGFEPQMTVDFSFVKAIENHFLLIVVSDKFRKQ